jgi:hypothetical protein
VFDLIQVFLILTNHVRRNDSRMTTFNFSHHFFSPRHHSTLSPLFFHPYIIQPCHHFFHPDIIQPCHHFFFTQTSFNLVTQTTFNFSHHFFHPDIIQLFFTRRNDSRLNNNLTQASRNDSRLTTFNFFHSNIILTRTTV